MSQTIAVTGHRTLPDASALEALARAALRDVEVGTVLSPLAEGADRLLARILLEKPGARLEAVLPLAADDYLADFATQASRSEFHDLLARSQNTTELPVQESREAAYAAVGRYVVDHCDLLVAVWDGLPARGRGGTAEVVAYARAQGTPVLRLWGSIAEWLPPESDPGKAPSTSPLPAPTALLDGRIPLVYGITGHRNLHPEALAGLASAIEKIFHDARVERPNTPLVLISPLARGADRLAAQVALRMSPPVHLVVVRPWPGCVDSADLGPDFVPPQDLLDRAHHVVEVPLDEGMTPDSLRACEEERRLQWEKVGAYVARQAQILIALWDGDEIHPSGTRRVMEWQRSGQPAAFAADLGVIDLPEGGPIWHVRTRRVGAPAPSSKPVLEFPGSASAQKEQEKHYNRVWDALEAYNRDFSGSADAQVESAKQLIELEHHPKLPDSASALLWYYARANAAALYHQNCTRHSRNALFLCGGLAVLCIEIYAHLWHPPQLLAVYVAILLGAILIHRYSHSQRHQERYLDHRALAEALRVQFFWTLGGLNDGVADHYLRQFRSELDWIRQALRASLLMSRGHGQGAPPTAAARTLIKRNWIDEQRKFFLDRAPARHRKHLRFEQAAEFFFGMVLGLAAVILALQLRHGGDPNHYLLVLMFLSVVATAICHEWSEKNGFAIDAHRYHWAASVFGAASNRFDTAPPWGLSALLRELGREALSENADWVVQHRHRPLTVINP